MMESLSKTDLISKLTKQNENLKRYETRLRDVVTAYKGLVKEKEALEASLSALNAAANTDNTDESVATLRLSLATVTAEKARIEEAYQSDKKSAREQTDKIIAELQEQLNSLSQQRQLEIENLRAKLDFEIQERERERSSHAAMIRELNTKLATEKKSKTRLEDKFSISTDSTASNIELEKRVRDLSSELEAALRKLNRAEARSVETPQMLVKMQEEISVMKQSHLAALREERVKALQAEESSRLLMAAQEDRVATLEARLADLSADVALYDRQRNGDQLLIQQLKDAVNSKDTGSHKKDETAETKLSTCETDAEKLADLSKLHNIIDNIHQLRKQLIVENERIGNPIDISSVFISHDISNEELHAVCRAELNTMRDEFDSYKRQFDLKNIDPVKKPKPVASQVRGLKLRIELLKEKLEMTESQIEDNEIDFAEKELAAKKEKDQLLDQISELIKRLGISDRLLFQQRERYSELLTEREADIRLKNDKVRRVSDDETLKMKSMTVSLQDTTSTPHMLHYAHELARKDLDISQLRKDKHTLEGHLRDSQRDATIQKDRFLEVKKDLKEEIDRLRRIQSREGANLEYLKNVVLSYLTSKGAQNRKHMLNAIAAVLHFTDSEKESVYKTKK